MARKALYDVKYFNNIDSEKKAYFLGWICADGYVSKKEYRDKIYYDVEISCALQDAEMMFKLGEEIKKKPKYKEFFDKRINKNKTYSKYILSFKAKNTYEDLINLFEDSYKADRKFPKLSSELVNHFIRGYFDGDGCLYRDKTDNWELAISGNRNVLRVISLKFGFRPKYYRDKTTYRLRFRRKDRIEKIYNYMYKNCHIYNPRRLRKFEEFASCKKSGKFGK